MLRGIGVGIVGVCALGYALRSLQLGSINLGGKGRDFFVSWAGDPALFAFGIVFMLVLGVGGLAAAWVMLRGDR